ncbi:hypothetical protein H4Q26_006033 [Puccinia striiformis f. sp. tritici PST-130]|nr:hypothetical protein H4Q26_006033 [Puccinia striiformis f. sp. tritici PST-130]
MNIITIARFKSRSLGCSRRYRSTVVLATQQNPNITELALFDVAPVVKGVAVDISHINTPSTVTGHIPEGEGLATALKGSDLVVIPAGINAGIVRDLATSMAQNCPKACILVISNPVNSTVPIVAEVFKKAGVFDPKSEYLKLQEIRNCFGHAFLGAYSANRRRPRIQDPGYRRSFWCDDLTPTLTSKPALPESILSDKSKVDELIKRIQFGGDEVVAAKDGAGSATLSMAYAGFRFAESLIKARLGQSGVVEMGYIYVADDKHISAHTEGLEYFSVPIELGVTEGVSKLLPIGDINDHEKEMLKACVSELKESIHKGSNFVNKL